MSPTSFSYPTGALPFYFRGKGPSRRAHLLPSYPSSRLEAAVPIEHIIFHDTLPDHASSPQSLSLSLSSKLLLCYDFNLVSMVSYVRMYHWPGLADCENVYNC